MDGVVFKQGKKKITRPVAKNMGDTTACAFWQGLPRFLGTSDRGGGGKGGGGEDPLMGSELFIIENLVTALAMPGKLAGYLGEGSHTV